MAEVSAKKEVILRIDVKTGVCLNTMMLFLIIIASALLLTLNVMLWGLYCNMGRVNHLRKLYIRRPCKRVLVSEAVWRSQAPRVNIVRQSYGVVGIPVGVFVAQTAASKLVAFITARIWVIVLGEL